MSIYALSSGPGTAGIAVLRISGTETKEVIKSITNGKLPKPRVATLRKINKINTSELIDEGIVIWFPGPDSYTGEDMAEIHVHGGKAVILAVQNEISKIENCKLAEPGEFTKLAFQNGKKIITMRNNEISTDMKILSLEINDKERNYGTELSEEISLNI